jgi:hypothetical protein
MIEQLLEAIFAPFSDEYSHDDEEPDLWLPRATYSPQHDRSGVPFWYSHEPIRVADGPFGSLVLETRVERRDPRRNLN